MNSKFVRLLPAAMAVVALLLVAPISMASVSLQADMPVPPPHASDMPVPPPHAADMPVPPPHVADMPVPPPHVADMPVPPPHVA